MNAAVPRLNIIGPTPCGTPHNAAQVQPLKAKLEPQGTIPRRMTLQPHHNHIKSTLHVDINQSTSIHIRCLDPISAEDAQKHRNPCEHPQSPAQ